jgi:hypothetical protein
LRATCIGSATTGDEVFETLDGWLASTLSHIATKRDGNTIGVAFMSKKEIPADSSTAGVVRCKFTQRQASSVKDNVP